MNPGSLNRRLTLLRAAGEREIVWGTLRQVWASVAEGKSGLIAPNAVKTPAIEAVVQGDGRHRSGCNRFLRGSII